MVSPDTTPDPGSRDLLRDLHARLERERGWRGRLRSLPTPLRLAVALAALAVVAAGVVSGLRRTDFADYPATLMAGSLAMLAALVVVVARLFLRPLQARQPGAGRILRWALVGLLVPLALALLPEAHHLVHEHPESFEGRGADFWPRAFRCFAFGTLTALPLLALLLLADRRDRVGFTRAMLAAVAAGLAGNLVLLLHCPLVGRAHLVAGHAGVALVFLAALGLALRARRM